MLRGTNILLQCLQSVIDYERSSILKFNLPSLCDMHHNNFFRLFSFWHPSLRPDNTKCLVFILKISYKATALSLFNVKIFVLFHVPGRRTGLFRESGLWTHLSVDPLFTSSYVLRSSGSRGGTVGTFSPPPKPRKICKGLGTVHASASNENR